MHDVRTEWLVYVIENMCQLLSRELVVVVTLTLCGIWQGTDGTYGTSLRYGVAMDPGCDVMVCFMQNGRLLQPDHGFPVLACHICTCQAQLVCLMPCMAALHCAQLKACISLPIATGRRCSFHAGMMCRAGHAACLLACLPAADSLSRAEREHIQPIAEGPRCGLLRRCA